jgi:hypothetical protein
MIPGAAVVIEGHTAISDRIAEVFRRTTSDDKGSYRFVELPAGRYHIRANAPGLLASALAVLKPGQSLDLQIVMSTERAKQPVAVNGRNGRAITAVLEQLNDVHRSVSLHIPNSPNKTAYS